ncbi:outer membrane beta-barrel protein [Waterburya agarophytonicola K14]|uniref:Outer membrane beta-barrel protein n=1 Tax=Waterburya agarophytonicola KI4 TaxID=2874699 RepID=A0A964BT56_9CYAN|nr:outer membrane beta-barrel protein [Waterburya agarophytonicola]MCC0178674.1 outer membrane beta-barrel protein [Waterburya agarophytonicola KI4]
MFRAIWQPNFWTMAKNATIAFVVILGFSQSAKAEDRKTYQAVRVSCNPFVSYDVDSQCNSNVSLEAETDKIAQTRRGRRRKSKVQGYYGGFSLGVGFPSGELEFGEIPGIEFSNPEYNTAFLGSLFGGIKFTKSLSADLEFLLGLGGVDSDSLEDSFNELATVGGIEGSLETDGDFSAFALYVNPRFELPLSQKGNFSLYVSPGIGISQTNVNFEAVSDFDGLGDQNLNVNQDASSTGITFQVKGGASIAFSDTLGVFAQVRYTTLPTDDGFDSINLFGADAGLKFNF